MIRPEKLTIEIRLGNFDFSQNWQAEVSKILEEAVRLTDHWSYETAFNFFTQKMEQKHHLYDTSGNSVGTLCLIGVWNDEEDEEENTDDDA